MRRDLPVIEPTKLEGAILFACRLHAKQTRKGTKVPYVFHLLAVAGLVAEAGGDEDQIVAALLHDAVEDAGGAKTREEIRCRFGEEVALLVDGCTDTDVEPKPPWRGRKEEYLARLRREPGRVRLVAAADKLHNARSLARDLRAAGEEVWSRFRGGKEGTLWYYDEVLRSLRDGWTHPIVDELERAVEVVRELAGDVGA